MTLEDVTAALSSRPVLLGFAFLGGMLVQCLSLLRRRPPKWGVITFAGMLLYMTAMMAYAVTSYPAEYIEEKLAEVILPQMFSFGFVFTFLFIAIFLKDVVRVIDEAVVFSLTLSFWFLVLHRADSVGPVTLGVAAGLGMIPTVGSIYLLLHKGEIRNVHRFFFYAWYLVVNGLFALAFFDHLPSDFFLTGGLRLTGEETFPTVFLLGMVCVHILFNVGILYYTFIYSLVSSDARKGLVAYSRSLFADRRMTRADLVKIAAFQLTAFAILQWMDPNLRFYMLSFWILLTPLIVMLLFAAVRTRTRAAPDPEGR